MRVGDRLPATFYFYNTPTSCVIFEEGHSIYHSGLNLTESGEWIPAPGFDDADDADADACGLAKILSAVREDLRVAFDRNSKLIECMWLAAQDLRETGRPRDAVAAMLEEAMKP